MLFAVASDRSLPGEIRLTAFRALWGVFRSAEVGACLWDVFRAGAGYEGLTLGVQDHLTLAYELALRFPERYGEIRALQEGRLGNPDLLREFRFIYRAVSPDKASRDTVFASLLKPEGRQIEPWAAAALGYLNHPLRQREAVGYIYPGLAELPEIQRTGDIFFPKNWCVNLLRGHESPEAALEVERYLRDHPELSPLLRDKLLQAADHLRRIADAEDSH